MSRRVSSMCSLNYLIMTSIGKEQSKMAAKINVCFRSFACLLDGTLLAMERCWHSGEKHSAGQELPLTEKLTYKLTKNKYKGKKVILRNRDKNV